MALLTVVSIDAYNPGKGFMRVSILHTAAAGLAAGRQGMDLSY
jgi:hypothetical protein